MPRLINKYSKFEATNNIGYAVILLDGYLKNMVSEEKRRELLAKLAIPALVESGSTDAVKALYGNRFDVPLSMAMEIALKENDKSSEMFGKGLWAQGDIGKYFNSPEMEDVFAEFNDGMQELLEILDANEDKMDFTDPNSMNSYRFMKGILKNSYEGTFSERIEEDPDYGAAVALTAKVGFETAGFAYSKKTRQVNIVKSGESNQKVLQGTRDTGIIEFMAGGTRVNEKIRENITTGNTSRQELLYEFDEQTKRLGKLMELTDEQTDRLRDMNILQNARDEFTNGNRGIAFASYDMQARRDALNAGYPVEDLAAMSAFYIQKELFQRAIDTKQKAYDKSVKKKPVVEGTEKEERDSQKAELDQLKGFYHDMTNVWQDVIDSKKGPLTQEKRVANLRKLKASAEKVTKKISPVPAGLINYSKRMEERENARLSTGDKALLAGNYTEMYNALNEADPRTLFTSSKQFRDLKNSMKELAEMERGLPVLQRDKSTEFIRKKHEVMEKAQSYLRYKSRQMNGPDGHRHKRSALEAKRVQAVDGLYNRLLADENRRDPKLKLRAEELPVVSEMNNKDLLTPPPKGEPRDYETYLKLHTGKGAMNGTKEEMVDEMAKVLAAMVLPKQNPPKAFNPRLIDQVAGQIKDTFNLDQMSEYDLREGLNDPKSAREAAQKNHERTYSVPLENYNKFLTDMRALYRDLDRPEKGEKDYDDYEKIYRGVEKLAHLPDLPDDPKKEGLSVKKLGALIEKTNSEIFQAMDKYVDHYSTEIGPKDRKVLRVLDAMVDDLKDPKLQARGEKLVGRINDGKGIKDVNDPGYIKMIDYDRREYHSLIQRNEDELKLNENYKAKLRDGLKWDVHSKEVRQEIAEIGEKARKEKRSREAMDIHADKHLTTKNLGNVKVHNRNTREAEDLRKTVKINEHQKSREEMRKKLDDGIRTK